MLSKFAESEAPGFAVAAVGCLVALFWMYGSGAGVLALIAVSCTVLAIVSLAPAPQPVRTSEEN